MEESSKRKYISVKWAWASVICYTASGFSLIVMVADRTGRIFPLIEPWIWLRVFTVPLLAIAGWIINNKFSRCNHCDRLFDSHYIAFKQYRYKLCPYCGGELDIE